MISEDIGFNPALRLMFSLLGFVGLFMAIRYGIGPVKRCLHAQEVTYDRVLRRQLLLDVEPRLVVWLNIGAVAGSFVGRT